MIKLPIVPLVLIYFACILAMVALAWLASLRRVARLRRQECREKVSCRACGHVFIDRSSSQFATCPHCGRPSERDQRSEI